MIPGNVGASFMHCLRGQASAAVGGYQDMRLTMHLAIKVSYLDISNLFPKQGGGTLVLKYIIIIIILKYIPFKEDTKRQPPPPLVIEGEPYYMVEAIVDHRDVSIRGGAGKTRREYLIKWEGYDSTHNTYEPETSLRQSAPLADAIDEYERKLKAKAQPKPAEDKKPSKRRR
ncbi:hypothetical protein Vafri_17822 [Volvox africanus]|uniref:Chromo domain-containing protein n=1 Tax=Volvox africanus TaxID=51714 RepID=A0A8J4BR62_9CHLO|nr:hypothetical protein Vafri_17822 [Volvox africanus]